jgi:hypothetical protein
MSLSRAQITELANVLLDTDDELDTILQSLGMVESWPSPNRDGMLEYDFDEQFLDEVRYDLRRWCRVYQEENSGEWRRARRKRAAAA